MLTAGTLPDNPAFIWIAEQAAIVQDRILAKGFSPVGASAYAEQQRGLLEGYIDLMRDPNSEFYHRSVDRFWRVQTGLTQMTNQHALYRDIIWGAQPSFKLYIDYKAENAAAGKVAG
jgi:hypothetical protein